MERLVAADAADAEPGAVLIGHTHNERTWSPSHGQPLSPAGYRDLFETVEPRIFGEAGLFADVVNGGPLDLSRRDSEEALDGDPALTLVATEHAGVFQPQTIEPPGAARGEFRINPLYAVDAHGDELWLSLRFPSPDYEDEYGACREYLPDDAIVSQSAFAALRAGGAPGPLADLITRRVIVDLPKRYY
jgi:hypothetical protein